MEGVMKIKRYTAVSMRAALALVRAEQGPDAVILSSRRGEGGIEVIAAVDYDEALFVAVTRQRAAETETTPEPVAQNTVAAAATLPAAAAAAARTPATAPARAAATAPPRAATTTPTRAPATAPSREPEGAATPARAMVMAPSAPAPA